MKIAVRENELFLETEWQDWIVNFNPNLGEPYITSPPYNYQIIEISDEINSKTLHYTDFDFLDGRYGFNKEKYLERIERETKVILRQRRNAECFPIINRGQIWYETLTEIQKEELRRWYQAWLDAPSTGTVAETPLWL